ncbi:MAG: hypothetical protein GF372_14345 [Candidatus Marinimicrobia bacterium]|nr:hypothetical protein [Candidatus Neomarinimicrobiota bacterium]
MRRTNCRTSKNGAALPQNDSRKAGNGSGVLQQDSRSSGDDFRLPQYVP